MNIGRHFAGRGDSRGPGQMSAQFVTVAAGGHGDMQQPADLWAEYGKRGGRAVANTVR